METTGGAKSCRPCLVTNAAVALVIAVLPLAIVLARDEGATVLAATAWMGVVLVYAVRRLRRSGYLPSVPMLARLTRLNRIVGPDNREAGGPLPPSPRTAAEGPRQHRLHRVER